jgi:O-antigen ligase/polysaccharide polymerase Wzy-like membrane protein
VPDRARFHSLGPNLPAILFLSALGALLAVTVLSGGGSTDRMAFPLGAALVVVLLAALAAGLGGWLQLPRVETPVWAAVALLAGLALWCAVSIDWSLAPERSWAYANRLFLYLLFLLAGLFAGAATRRAPTILAAGLSIMVAATAGWALASKIAPSLADDGSPVARLRAPVGYWNGLAFLLAVGLPLALWIASKPSLNRMLRAAGVTLATALVAGILLTYSRGGVLVAVVAVGAWFALVPRRRASAEALLLALVGAAAVFAVALLLPGVTDDGQFYGDRRHDGQIFGAILAGVLVAVFGLAWLGLRFADRLPSRSIPKALAGRRLAIVAAVVLVGLIAAAFASGAAVRELREFANPPDTLLTQEAGRFTSLSSNNRWTWWNEAWTAFRDEPLKGTGASSFPVVHRLLREDPLTVTTPHSTPLQLLGELGVVGGLLAGAAAALVLVVATRNVRRLPGPARAPAAALLAGLLAFAVFALLDFPLDFLAVSAPVFLCAGVLLAQAPARQTSAGRVRWLGLAAATVGAAILLVSLAAPWLSARRIERTYALLDAGRQEEALAAAESATSLNPLALDATFAEARANVALGNFDQAREVLLDGVRDHELDANAWSELARLELALPGREEIAASYLERSRVLDPYASAG